MASSPVQEATGKDASHIDGFTPEESKEIFTLRDKLRECQDKEEEAKEQHASAKKATSVAQSQLNDFIDEVRNPSLFSNMRTEETEKPKDDTLDWRSIDLDELGIPAGIQEELESNDPPLVTFGAIIDYTDSEKRLTAIAGVGAGKAETIDNCIDTYLSEHPDVKSAVYSRDDDSDRETEAEDTDEERDHDGEEMDEMKEEGLQYTARSLRSRRSNQ